jgi:hypothetical protein
VNHPEAEARLEKALRMVDLLDAVGITSEQVAGFQPEHWDQVAAAARVHRPSSQTQDRVLTMLRNREAAKRLFRTKSAAETERQAAEIRIRAERRAGELLKLTAETGQRKGQGMKSGDTISLPPTLSEIGISPDQSSQWQKLAAIPQEAAQ